MWFIETSINHGELNDLNNTLYAVLNISIIKARQKTYLKLSVLYIKLWKNIYIISISAHIYKGI